MVSRMLILKMFGILLGLVICANGVKLPSYIKGCTLSDTHLNDCAKSSALHGLPRLLKGDKKFKIPSLIPLHLDEVKLDVGDSLKMSFNNVTIYGIEDAILNEIKINPDEKKWMIQMNIPLMTMIITYHIQGRILVLPIVGHGPGNFTLENVNFTYTFNYDLETKNGEEYITIKDSTLIYEPSRVYFSLENLFNGDDRLGLEMNKFLNENWLDVSKEIYPALAETINAIVTSVYNGYFSKVPYHDILSP